MGPFSKFGFSSAAIMLVLCMNFMAQAEDHYYDFVLSETNFTRNCVTKTMLTVNESFPGPTIRVSKGDTAFVNVYNGGYYGVTIHWHGVKQPRNPWSDGPEYITQCAIAPGTNFTYKIIFSDEEGTLWWHAHSDWSLATVHGAIVIYPVQGSDSQPFPEPHGEDIIIFESWYDEEVNEAMWTDLTTGAELPIADFYAINGQLGDFSNCSSTETIYRSLVDYGNTYLLRLINAAPNSEFFFAIADHNLTVVGMDGTYVKPFTTSYIVISPGQTMNVLFTANQSTLGQYYMAAREYVTGTVDVTNCTTAILEYNNNSSNSSTGSNDTSSIPPPFPVFPDDLPGLTNIEAAENFWSKLRSLADDDHPIDVPLNVTTRMFIELSQKEIPCVNASCDSLDGNKVASTMNNISFMNPSTDVLLAYYQNISGVFTADFPDRPSVFYNFTGIDDTVNATEIATKVKILDYNETVEIIFQGTNLMGGAVDHPMHLHGHTYYAVGSGIGNFNFTHDPDTYNLVDPLEVNTFRVRRLGWSVVRFRANNPGVWLWHCHLAKHLTWGMKTAFITRSGGTPETTVREPPPSMPPCKSSFNHLIVDFEDDSGATTIIDQ